MNDRAPATRRRGVRAVTDAKNRQASRGPAGMMSAARPSSSRRGRLPSLFTEQRRPAGQQQGVTIKGLRRSPRDLYHWLLTTSWALFAAIGLGVYLAANAVFAFIYLGDPH